MNKEWPFVSIAASIKSVMVPINREGYPFIAAFALTALVFGVIWPVSLALLVPLTLWCVFFFRDPPRVSPSREGLIVAPADGRIVTVAEHAVPAELAALEWQRATKISIFMNVFDCHVNRAPAAGSVVSQVYSPGVFVNAELDKASANNERNALVLETRSGPIGVVQVAGLVARRIVSWVSEGDLIETGQRFGMIRFGSRLDVYLPAGAAVRVAVGQRAVGGETVLADLNEAGNAWTAFATS